VWPQLINLTWFRQNRKQKNQSPQTTNVISEEPAINNTSLRADEFYSGEFLMPPHGPIEERLLNPADEFYPNKRLTTLPATKDVTDEAYPMVIKNLVPPTRAQTNLSFPPSERLHSAQATSILLPIRPAVNEPETRDTSGAVLPHISQSQTISAYQGGQIERSGNQPVKDAGERPAQAERQRPLTDQSRWSEKASAASTLRVAPYPESILGPHPTLYQAIRSVYATPVWLRLHLTTTAAGTEPEAKAAGPNALRFIANMPGVTIPGEATIPALGNYDRPTTLGKGTNLLFSLPDRDDTFMPRILLKRLSLPTIPSPTRSLNEPVLDSRSPDKFIFGKDLAWSPTSVTPHREPETPVDRVKAMKITEDSASMTPSPVMFNVTTPESRQTGRAGMPIIHREFPSVADLHHQPLTVPFTARAAIPDVPQTSETETPVIYREPPPVAEWQQRTLPLTDHVHERPALPPQPYYESPGSTPSPDSTVDFGFLENQEYVPSPLDHHVAHWPVLGPPPVSIIEPGAGVKASRSEGVLSALFEGTTYYERPAPELALAPVGRKVETASPTIQMAETGVEETEEETATPDIDALARDVYVILKRRLTRERERALGVI